MVFLDCPWGWQGEVWEVLAERGFVRLGCREALRWARAGWRDLTSAREDRCRDRQATLALGEESENPSGVRS